MNDKRIEFPCLEVEQPIGTFYIGVIDSRDLVAISYADVRRPDGREIERYIGTQRDLSEGRVAEIKQYVTNIDSCFPTSIILAINSEYAEYDEQNKLLNIKKDKEVAKIIDGQHRIAGLEEYEGSDFKLNVTIFIDMDIEDQAMVFATINLKQTKVTKSLAYDLYEYTELPSPQKTCHNIAKLMHNKEGSPFYRRIKILGKSTGIGTEVITQSTFVDRLLRLITNNAMKDKDIIKRTKKRKRLEKAKSRSLKTQVFRKRFIEDKDAEIARIVWNYFKAVEEKWPDAWNDFNRGQILSRTTGFAALLRLLPLILNDVDDDTSIPKQSLFFKYIDYSSLSDEDFTSDKFLPGSSGEGELLKSLKSDIFKKK